MGFSRDIYKNMRTTVTFQSELLALWIHCHDKLCYECDSSKPQPNDSNLAIAMIFVSQTEQRLLKDIIYEFIIQFCFLRQLLDII